VSETRPLRPGEEVDLNTLNAFLASDAPQVGHVATVEQFPGGFSNLTYLLKTDRGEFVLRRPPRGVAKGSAHDMGREHRILSALSTRGVAAPKPIVLCDDESVLGAPFYIMERVRGVILRGAPRDPPSPDVMRKLSESFVDTLVAIHRIGPSDPAIGALGKPDGYIARQVGGWTSRWEKSRTDDVPSMERVAAWLASHQPHEGAATLVHNDYKYDNLVLDPDVLSHVHAVLDWEMATLGDPLLDVGTSLGYWVEAGDHPAFRALGLGATALPGNFTRAELWQRYLEKADRASTDPTFYYVFGLFKIAVIAQQIYFRFRRGLTTDERFARLGEAVQLLVLTAASAIERGSIAPERGG
jgi:aminoglycoside phosphotransferase (APT) family kinase protein